MAHNCHLNAKYVNFREAKTVTKRISASICLWGLLTLTACGDDDDGATTTGGDTGAATDTGTATTGDATDGAGSATGGATDTDATDSTTGVTDSAGSDSSDDASVTGDGDDTTDTGGEPQPFVWSPGLPQLEGVSAARGRRWARSSIHLHSVFSHDACDGGTNPDGSGQEECLADLRRALCTLHYDFAFMTEHTAYMNMQSTNFQGLYLTRPGDRVESLSDGSVANVIACDDGHEVRLMPGQENDITPVGLLEHIVTGTQQDLDAAYNPETPETIELIHAAGGAAGKVHPEQADLSLYGTLPIDWIEVYNLHAVVDPKINKKYLGLESGTAIAAFGDCALNQEDCPWPDLVFLAFTGRIQRFYDVWNTLNMRRYAEDKPLISAVTGHDAHQNVLKLAMADGERGDSYRRVLRWFSTWVSVPELTHHKAVEALRAGHTMAVFELFGTPDGFDFYAMDSKGTVLEMGTEAKVEGGSPVTFTVKRPKVLQLEGFIGSATVKIRVVKLGADADTPFGKAPTEIVVAESESDDIEFQTSEPGIFRAEVQITPDYIDPLLTKAHKSWLQTYDWVITSAIAVK